VTAFPKLPRPIPLQTPETEPFWSAAAEGKLLLKCCNTCEVVMWYPRSMCPECGSLDTRWIKGSGAGTVYTFTVNHKGDGPYRGDPYVLAYVELAEGPRVMTNVINIDPAQVTIGMPVQVIFEPDGEGSALMRFEPVPQQD
jgi:hypothetical protein